MRIPLLGLLILCSLFVLLSGCHEHSRPYGEVGPAREYYQPAGAIGGAAPSYDDQPSGAVGPAPRHHHRHYRTDDPQGYDDSPAGGEVGPAR
ncbi:MAG: hypothetical protein HZB31_10930 [Nitrospirae bacterium]|nr:hypothetical protein [Nitrospirota bacterium]